MTSPIVVCSLALLLHDGYVGGAAARDGCSSSMSGLRCRVAQTELCARDFCPLGLNMLPGTPHKTVNAHIQHTLSRRSRVPSEPTVRCPHHPCLRSRCYR
jgi:hypothetical protein